MATLDKIFTDKSPNLMIGGTALRFEKLFLRSGKIEELEFSIHWKSQDPQEGAVIISNSVLFRPAGFTDLSVPPSNMHVFRQDFEPSVFNIGENQGIEIIAHSDSSTPFDLTLFFEFDTN